MNVVKNKFVKNNIVKKQTVLRNSF